MSDTANPAKSQLDKFKEAARELECDDDETRFEEKLGKLTKQKPKEEK
jgi:hypothetical protein